MWKWSKVHHLKKFHILRVSITRYSYWYYHVLLRSEFILVFSAMNWKPPKTTLSADTKCGQFPLPFPLFPGDFKKSLFISRNLIIFFRVNYFSQLSAIAIMAIPAEIYSFGWQYMLILPTLFFITFVTNYLFLPVFYHNNIDNCYVVGEWNFGWRFSSDER